MKAYKLWAAAALPILGAIGAWLWHWQGDVESPATPAMVAAPGARVLDAEALVSIEAPAPARGEEPPPPGVAGMPATFVEPDPEGELDNPWEWTRETWAAKPAWQVSYEAFAGHFGFFWNRAGRSPEELAAAWELPGVQVTFRNVQSLRRDLLWELMVMDADEDEDEHVHELNRAVIAEGRVVAELIGVVEAWDSYVAEQAATTPVVENP